MYIYTYLIIGNSLEKFSRLSAGPHKITVCFTVASTCSEITQLPDEFTVDQIGGYRMSNVESCIVNLKCSLQPTFPYLSWKVMPL